jgi:hypothetical protein
MNVDFKQERPIFTPVKIEIIIDNYDELCILDDVIDIGVTNMVKTSKREENIKMFYELKSGIRKIRLNSRNNG